MSRLDWQRKNIVGYTVLNLGCESDPGRLANDYGAVNVDIDDWSGTVHNFVQADATLGLPMFGDLSFDTVVMGDMLEHVEDQPKVIATACRIAKKRILITLPTDDSPEPEGRAGRHVEYLKTIGLKEVAPGDLQRRHGHDHAYDYRRIRELVSPVFKAHGFAYSMMDTGDMASPGIGVIADRIE